MVLPPYLFRGCIYHFRTYLLRVSFLFLVCFLPTPRLFNTEYILIFYGDQHYNTFSVLWLKYLSHYLFSICSLLHLPLALVLYYIQLPFLKTGASQCETENDAISPNIGWSFLKDPNFWLIQGSPNFRGSLL